jgi:hypothetical protein
LIDLSGRTVVEQKIILQDSAFSCQYEGLNSGVYFLAIFDLATGKNYYGKVSVN